MFDSLMPLRRRSRAGSDEAREAFLPQQQQNVPAPSGLRALVAKRQWTLVGVAVVFALVMLYVFVVSFEDRRSR